MEMWIQGALFGTETAAVAGRPEPKRRLLGDRRTKHAGWMPVTRDPDVALSHGESIRVASDFRLGLARALAQMPQETRIAIRRAVDPGRRRTAA